MANAQPLLTVRGVSKAFLGVSALENVDFTLKAGEVHALLGENGAGKSTLIKIITGAYRRDEGEVLLEGTPIFPRDVVDAQKLGTCRMPQRVIAVAPPSGSRLLPITGSDAAAVAIANR